MILGLVDEAVASGASQARASEETGVDERTLQRWRRRDIGDDMRAGPSSTPGNKLNPEERANVLQVACSVEFRDKSPKQVVPILADRGEYVASEATFYRVLREENLMKHRGRAKAPTKRARPSLKVATGTSQLWSWDITYLPGPIRGTFFYLYVIVDVWSRKIVGRAVHLAESTEHAGALIEDACVAEGIERGQLTLHSDNGSPMKGATMLATLQSLGVLPSFSRPSVSDDNPYSEALFRTTKYCPMYPSKPFESVEAARAWVGRFVAWYNDEHRHSAIRFVTPSDRHAGRHLGVPVHRGPSRCGRSAARASRSSPRHRATRRRAPGGCRPRATVASLFLSDEGRMWLDRCVVNTGPRTLVQAQRAGHLVARETLFRGENQGLYNIEKGVLAAVVIDVLRDPLGRRPTKLRLSPRFFHLVGEGQRAPGAMKLPTEPLKPR